MGTVLPAEPSLEMTGPLARRWQANPFIPAASFADLEGSKGAVH